MTKIYIILAIILHFRRVEFIFAVANIRKGYDRNIVRYRSNFSNISANLGFCQSILAFVEGYKASESGENGKERNNNDSVRFVFLFRALQHFQRLATQNV